MRQPSVVIGVNVAAEVIRSIFMQQTHHHHFIFNLKMTHKIKSYTVFNLFIL